MELTFKDLNGTELKPGDIILRPIGSRMAERRIESITFSASTRMGPDGVTPEPKFSTYIKTSRKGGRCSWHKPDAWYQAGKLYTGDSHKVIKKAA